MSTFREYLAEQLRDPEFRKWWEARMDLLVRQVDGNMTLSDMPLDEEDKARIRYAAEHPEEFDAILDQIIHEHKVDVKAFDEAVAEHKKNPVTYTMDDVKKLLEED